MSLGKLFKSLFPGNGKAPLPDPVDYMGFTIQPDPLYEDGKYRTAGYISGELDGETRQVRFIRADQHGDVVAATDHAIRKAQQIIDEQGKRLLEKSHL